MEQFIDLGEARVDPHHGGGTLREQVVAEGASAIHLDKQSAEVANGIGSRFEEHPAFTPQNAGVWAAWRDAFTVGGAPAEERHSGGTL